MGLLDRIKAILLRPQTEWPVIAQEKGEASRLMQIGLSEASVLLRKIASYGDPTGLGPSFACYSANDGVFTFLKLGEGNELQVIRAEAQ